MKNESRTINNAEGREGGENKVFDFEVNESSRCINFAGSRRDVLDFLGRLLASSVAHDPDRQGYARRRGAHSQSEEHHVGRFLEDSDKAGRSYEFTASPFRLYIRTADREQPHILKKLNAGPDDSRWFVKMPTNRGEYTEEDKQRTWKEVKDNFERVRQEMIAERSGS